jgi:methionine-rich copper-binding protein CopC
MDAVRFDFGDMLEPWMIPSISTEPTNALKVLSNIFDTHNPKVRITPFGEADKERAELAERWVEFHFAKINQRAGKSPLRQLPHFSGKYGRVALQVDYLPYWLPKDKKKWTSEQKQQMRGGPYCIEIHNPRNIYYEMGKYGLRWVASVTNMTPQEVINHWGVYDDKSENGKKIQSAIKKIESEYDKDDEIRFIHVDFTSHDKRQVSVFKTSRETIEEFEEYTDGQEQIVILDSENKLGFLNWAVVECDSTPLLAGMHKGNLYAFQTIFDTAKKSGVMRRTFPPLMKSKTLDGKGVNVDYTGAEPEIKLKPGEEVESVNPPPMDNAVFTLAQELEGKVNTTLGVSKLGNMEAGGNLQYSTVSAIIDLNMNNLEPYKRTAEKALEQVAYIMFKWVEFTEDTVTAYRTNKANPEQIMGEEIMMNPEVIGDADELLIKIDLTSKSDKMQAINRISTLKQSGFRIPDKELLEEVGYEDPDMLAAMWEDEQLQSTALQILIKELQGKKDLELQAATLQMQNEMAMQQQQQMMAMQPQDPNAQGPMGQMANPDQSNPSAVGGQGFNPAMGGTPPMMAEPGMTATQVPGERMI